MPSQGLYERFVNFYTDFAFKKFFGTPANKEFLIAEISKYDTAERLAYQDSLKDYRDYYNTIYTAKEEGRAEERAKAHKEKLEMARKMKADGMPVEMVSKYSGLSVDEVADI